MTYSEAMNALSWRPEMAEVIEKSQILKD